MTLRPTPLLAMAVLLGTAAWLPSPVQAGEASPRGQRLTMEQTDVMAPDDDSDGPADRTGSQRRERWSGNEDDEDHEARFDRRGGQDRVGQDRVSQDQDDQDRGRRDRSWDEARHERLGGWERRGRDDREDGERDGWSPERRRMAAMHVRMMRAGRQPAAAFRIEIGDTRMAVRCSPRETMRECADAALSVANRLREASTGNRSGGGTAAPATPSSPGSAGSAPGGGNPSIGIPGNGNPGSGNSGGTGGAGGSTVQ